MIDSMISKCLRPRHLRSIFMLLILFWFSLLSATVSNAQETVFPITPAEISATPEVNFRLKNAKVAYANYEAIKQVVPALVSADNSIIDSWILRNYAYISAEQLKLLGIRFVGRSHPHPLDLPAGSDFAQIYNADSIVDVNDRKISFRPKEYHRADLMQGFSQEKSPIAFIERKGVGRDAQFGHITEAMLREFSESDRQPNRAEALGKLFDSDHSDGLMSGGEAVAETSREMAVRYSMQISNAKFGAAQATVMSLFILDTGLDILRSGVSGPNRIAAAIYGREGHWRASTNFLTGEPSRLRVPHQHDRYSTSYPSPTIVTDESGWLQRSIGDALVDFGGVVVKQQQLTHNFAIEPGSEIWDSKLGRKKDNPQRSNPWKWGHETYGHYISSADSLAISRHIDEMLAPIAKEYSEKTGGSIQNENIRNRLKAGVLRWQSDSAAAMSDFVQIAEKGNDRAFVDFLFQRLPPRALKTFLSKLNTNSLMKLSSPQLGDRRGEIPFLTAKQFVTTTAGLLKFAVDPTVKANLIATWQYLFTYFLSTPYETEAKEYQKYLAALLEIRNEFPVEATLLAEKITALGLTKFPKRTADLERVMAKLKRIKTKTCQGTFAD